MTGILRLATPVRLTSRKQKVEDWSEYPLLTQKGIDLIKWYFPPRVCLTPGRYGSYKDYGESTWRIGYGSKKLGKHTVSRTEIATQEEVDKQLIEDLKAFSSALRDYIYVPLNNSKKAALLSFAHDLGLAAFKECRLLKLINQLASKTEIISEWSPYINQIWFSGGNRTVDRRRTELNVFYAADKEIPTQLKHNCNVEFCLLNLPETYNGASNQIKAIEYLEAKILEWDPDGRSLRHFYRLWGQKPAGLGSRPRPLNVD